jgi:hypothetical protein
MRWNQIPLLLVLAIGACSADQPKTVGFSIKNPTISEQGFVGTAGGLHKFNQQTMLCSADGRQVSTEEFVTESRSGDIYTVIESATPTERTVMLIKPGEGLRVGMGCAN